MKEERIVEVEEQDEGLEDEVYHEVTLRDCFKSRQFILLYSMNVLSICKLLSIKVNLII